MSPGSKKSKPPPRSTDGTAQTAAHNAPSTTPPARQGLRHKILQRLIGRLPDDFIVAETYAGLGDRMIVLESAILLGRELGHRVYLSWPLSEYLNCRFKDLFQMPERDFELLKRPLWNQHLFYRLLPPVFHARRRRIHLSAGLWLYTKWRNLLNYQRYGFETTFDPPDENYLNLESGNSHGLHELTHKRRILLRGYLNAYRALYPNSPERPFNYLQPTAELQERINSVTQHFTPNTIGVHIRLGDAQWRRRRRYPVSEFIRLMRQEISRDHNVNFFLASDSPTLTARLKVLFGDRIVTQPKAAQGSDSTEGIKSAVVDLYALARTRKIISGLSNFARIAAQIELKQRHVVDLMPPAQKRRQDLFW